jgi:ribokinase
MILTFGSINADIVVPVPKLPQPGETVLGGSYEILPGGKGANQALAARRAGADVMLAGAVGRDDFSAIALASLRGEGVDTRLVRNLELPTGCALIMVSAAGENIIAVSPGANMGVRCDWVSEDLLDAHTTLVAQFEVSPGETQALIRRVRRRGGRCVLNLAPALPIDLALLPEIDLLVANESEAATMSSDPMGIAGRLRQGLVVTRGAAGASAFLAGGGRIDLPALAIDPVDTTGAGDTFVGVLAAALDLGASLEAALRRASAAAGLACLARGAQTAMPGAAAIDAAMANLPPVRPGARSTPETRSICQCRADA